MSDLAGVVTSNIIGWVTARNKEFVGTDRLSRCRGTGWHRGELEAAARLLEQYLLKLEMASQEAQYCELERTCLFAAAAGLTTPGREVSITADKPTKRQVNKSSVNIVSGSCPH